MRTIGGINQGSDVFDTTNATHRIVGAGLAPAHDVMHWMQ
jgi:hypothetical protein